MKTAEQLRELYLDFADNMEPPPQSRYARALGAISADYEACLSELRAAMEHFQKSAWRDTSDMRMCEIHLRRALKSSEPTLPLRKKSPEVTFP